MWRLPNGIVMASYCQLPEPQRYTGQACEWAKAQTDFGCVEAAIWIGEPLEMLLKDPEHPD
jgi:hypothetical protein